MKLPQIFFKRGFTLIELLVVITIIIILAAVVMIAINPAEMARRGRDATRLSDIENVRKALDLGIAEGTISVTTTATISSCDALITRGCGDGTNWIGGMNVCNYLSVLPVDPQHTQVPCVAYYYEGDGVNGTYELNLILESTSNDTKEQNDGGNNAARYELGTDPGLDLIP